MRSKLSNQKYQTYLIQQLNHLDKDEFRQYAEIIEKGYFKRELHALYKKLLECRLDNDFIPDDNYLNANVHNVLLKPIAETPRDVFQDEINEFIRLSVIDKNALASTNYTGDEGFDLDKAEKILFAPIPKIGEKSNDDFFVDDLLSADLDFDEIFSEEDKIPTGYEALDKKMLGGVEKGETTLIVGPTGGGKSNLLLNIAFNWVMDGYKVLYISLENPKKITARRLLSYITGEPLTWIFSHQDETKYLYKKWQKENSGKEKFKFDFAHYGTGHIEDIHRRIEEVKPDCLVLDYIDIMPNKNFNSSDRYAKDEANIEGIASLAATYNIAALTASQFNRTGMDNSNRSMDQISGGVSKLYTVRNVWLLNVVKGDPRISLDLAKAGTTGAYGTVPLTIDLNTYRVSDADYEIFKDVDEVIEHMGNIPGILVENGELMACTSNAFKNYLDDVKYTYKGKHPTNEIENLGLKKMGDKEINGKRNQVWYAKDESYIDKLRETFETTPTQWEGDEYPDYTMRGLMPEKEYEAIQRVKRLKKKGFME